MFWIWPSKFICWSPNSQYIIMGLFFRNRIITEIFFSFVRFVFFKFLLLFNYSCWHFLPIPPPHPNNSHLPPHLHPPPWFCPCVFYSSSCKPLSPLSRDNYLRWGHTGKGWAPKALQLFFLKIAKKEKTRHRLGYRENVLWGWRERFVCQGTTKLPPTIRS